MRKLLMGMIALGSLAGSASFGSAGAAVPVVVSVVVPAVGMVEPLVQTVQYREPNWRERQELRRRRELEFRRREELRRREEWRRAHGYRPGPPGFRGPPPGYGPRY